MTNRLKALAVNEISCEALDDVEPQSLAVTYTFEAPKVGVAGSLPIRFTGKWVGRGGTPTVGASTSGGAGVGGGAPTGATRFEEVRKVPLVVPGSGRISFTTRFKGVANGEWQVRAQPQGLGLPPVNSHGHSGLSLVVNEISPGTRVGAWPGMVLLGAIFGTAIIVWLAARAGISWPAVLGVLVVSALIGLVGARVYYLAESRKKVAWFSTAGLCIQGFVIGMFAGIAIGSLIIGAPPLEIFDFTAPGLMIGMFIGRFGCFWGGCCVGRQTNSRWALWSSDRRVGAKRIPVQLFEGVASLVICAVALTVLIADPTAPNGTVFIGVIAAYVLVRQLLFPLRDLPRKTSWGRITATVIAVLVLAGSIVLLISA